VVFGGNGVVDGVQCGKASLGVTSAAPIAFWCKRGRWLERVPAQVSFSRGLAHWFAVVKIERRGQGGSPCNDPGFYQILGKFFRFCIAWDDWNFTGI
jgi:hypothetical protein